MAPEKAYYVIRQKFYTQPYLIYFSVTRLTSDSVMNYAEEILHAIFLAIVVANFLLNTSRALKAIELCRESLVLFSNKVLSVKKPLQRTIYRQIYHTMFEAYRRVSDHSNAIACGWKLLTILRECGDTFPRRYA